MKKIIGILSVLGLVATVSAETWNAGTADWNVAANWNPTSVPNGTSQAVINNGGTAQITGNVPDVHLGVFGSVDTVVGNNSGSGNVVQSAGTFNAGNVDIGFGTLGVGDYTKTGGDLNVGWINVGRSGSGGGTLTHSGGSLNNSSWFAVATGNNSVGTYNLSGTAVHTGGNSSFVSIGSRTGSDGELNMSGDASLSTPSMTFNQNNPNLATRAEANLDGGTLLVQDIRLEGSVADLNWGSTTISYRLPNAGAAGGFAVNGPGGEDPQRGSTLTVRNIGAGTLDSQASLATGSGINEGNGGASTLDLRGFYINGGTRFDVLTLEGSLDLTADLDTLRFGSADNFLRPFGRGNTDWGSLTLINAAQGITGEFDTFDYQGNILSPYTDPFPGSAGDLPLDRYYLEYTANEVIFHYNIGGTVPEPSTTALFVVGIVFIRFMRGVLKVKR